MELRNRVALVTGSTSGIGAETARLLASEGAEVIITGRQSPLGERVVEEIRGAGGSARYVEADLANRGAIHHLVRSAGAIDILVNNAAYSTKESTVGHEAESFDRAFEVNVRAPFFLVAGLAASMLAKGRGCIVNVSTMAATLGMPGLAAYSASKAALESLTRTWAAEFAGSGVRVNGVAPGPTATERAMAKWGDAFEDLGRSTLLLRAAAPAEIAQTILFLASDRASYLTGVTLPADGGRTVI